MDNSEICKCKAEVCAQYVVKNIILDNVYDATRSVLEKIEGSISGNTSHGYTMLWML